MLLRSMLQPRYDRIMKISTELLILRFMEVKTVVEALVYRANMILGGVIADCNLDICKLRYRNHRSFAMSLFK